MCMSAPINKHPLLLRYVIAVHEDGNVYTARGVMPVRATAGIHLECGHVISRDEFNRTLNGNNYQCWCQQCASIPHSKTNPEALEQIEHEAARRNRRSQ